MAEDWRFSPCRRDYARHLPQSVQKTLNTQRSEPVCGVALCHRKSALPELDPKEETHDAIAGWDIYGRNREILLYPLCIGAARDRTSERRSEIVKKLLARLPESERTVVTLYYLGEMNAKEIGKFLGVSVKTIHSRLHRARKRLQEKEELLVSDVLGGVQLPTSLTENIMQQVADLKPTPPPVGKPLLPWAAFGTTVIMVLLLLGASNQYITRFQKPYSFEAQSEPTIQIIDALIVLDVDSKPAVRSQVGRAAHSERKQR